MDIRYWIFVLLSVSLSFAQTSSDTVVKAKKPNVYYKSSGSAMALSAVFPGGGQFYTASYIKGALFVGAEATLAYYALKDHLDYQETHDVKFRNHRNNLLWWIASVKLLSIADAYVSANLYKFKDQMKLTIDYQPDQNNFKIGLLINTQEFNTETTEKYRRIDPSSRRPDSGRPPKGVQ